jgi:hypothetical protein
MWLLLAVESKQYVVTVKLLAVESKQYVVTTSSRK